MNELNSPTLKSLNETQCYNALIDILTEIKLLTGVAVPKDRLGEYVAILQRFFMSSSKFRSLTKNEILHAFNLNSQGELDNVYRFYNRELNAEFIGDVLLAYLKFKKAIYGVAGDAIIDMVSKAQSLKIEPPKISSDHWRMMIQWDYEYYKADMSMFIFNTTPKYLYLRRMGLIILSSKGSWINCYRQALQHREYETRMESADTEGKKARKNRLLDMYTLIKETGIVPREEHISNVHATRRLIYLRFFELLRSTAINDIFTEIEIEK